LGICAAFWVTWNDFWLFAGFMHLLAVGPGLVLAGLFCLYMDFRSRRSKPHLGQRPRGKRVLWLLLASFPVAGLCAVVGLKWSETTRIDFFNDSSESLTGLHVLEGGEEHDLGSLMPGARMRYHMHLSSVRPTDSVASWGVKGRWGQASIREEGGSGILGISTRWTVTFESDGSVSFEHHE